jgi:hypothetical protein
MADRKQAEQLAYVMQFLYSLGFDLDTVKRAADAWWQIKGAPVSGVALPDEAQSLEALPVAYLRSITHPDWLELCSKDEPGAFPVFASHADLVRSVGSAYGVEASDKGVTEGGNG